MKLKKIHSSEINPAHPTLHRGYATDNYYTKFANILQEDLVNSGVYLGASTPNIIRYTAITLTCYMEDIVADSGQWHMFSSLCQDMFGWPVPMYHDKAEEYYPDEPSLMAVRYLVWHAANEMDDSWWHPNSRELDELATIAYKRLCDEFENAPVNEQLTADIDNMLKESEYDFNKMRISLVWLISNCYLIRTADSEELMERRVEKLDSLANMMPEARMRKYYAYMDSLFVIKFGPLALYPKQYLAALARTKSMHEIANALDIIEVIPTSTFQYAAIEDGKKLHMLCTSGRAIDVERDEFMLNDEKLFSNDGCLASFIFYQDKWRLNGVMTTLDKTKDLWEKLRKKDPSNIPEGQAIADAEWYLQHTDGQQLFFFSDNLELKQFMVEKLKCNMDMPADYRNENVQDQPMMLFIDKNEPMACLSFSYGFCPCIDAPNNPYYDRSAAMQEAVEMLWNSEGIGTGAVLYLLDKGYLPDILNDELIIQEGSQQTRTSDARFLLRYMRQYRY